jgi:phosphatidylserine/phosphatidylglycerophosphate/cardiolipin synthase-like enzyme
VIDGKVVLIGSYNLDPRSQNLNTEVMCLGEDETVAKELLASMQRHIENSWRVLPNGRIARSELAPVSRSRAISLWVARLLMIPIVEAQM